MPLCTIDEFEQHVLDFQDLNTGLAANRYTGSNEKIPGVFVFYQADVDGTCAMFILEVCQMRIPFNVQHHKCFSNGLPIVSLPIRSEGDIYTFIKKSLSIRKAYPEIQVCMHSILTRQQPDLFLRVVLLGIYGWDLELLCAIKVYFEQLLPEGLRLELKICLVPSSRPLSFFNVNLHGEWYFFLLDEQQVDQETETRPDVANGIWSSGSTSAAMATVSSQYASDNSEQIVKPIHESNQAAVYFAACIGILSKYEHSSELDVGINGQITRLYHEMSLLGGGPYCSFDSDRSILPLVTFMSIEQAFKISPSVLIYDPKRERDTFADLRIHCNLKTHEFSSEFVNLDPKRQSLVLKLLRNKIDIYKEKMQICWLRRTLSVPALDVLYILMATLAGWDTRDESHTSDRAPLIASDFLHATIADRMSQDSSYDRTILTQLKQRTNKYIGDIYNLITGTNTKSKTFGTHKVLSATLYPKQNLGRDDCIFIGYMLSAIQARIHKTQHSRCMLLVKNPHQDRYFCFGYSPEVSAQFPDVWPLVFSSLAHDDDAFQLDALDPNKLEIKNADLYNARDKITQRLLIALQANYIANDESQEEDLDLE
ncbi:hypothetical protein BdWA1_002280 [Babesia duncani]|uniref:Uncharacterized protein n=1 Tax=Babesia duncani TaxID=323732 RepID=A0AAD9UNE5_9APIC|nr:hypothetical protein BdWA1_002280 [Babesia duncani]